MDLKNVQIMYLECREKAIWDSDPPYIYAFNSHSENYKKYFKSCKKKS